MIASDIVSVKNWSMGNTIDVLNHIHQQGVNIAIYNRDISALENNISALLEKEIATKLSGSTEVILEEMTKTLGVNSPILVDIKELLGQFQKVADVDSFRLLLSTVKSNMCRKFHTDINDLRLLCTYHGPGTLWLTDDNIDSNAFKTRARNIEMVIDENDIQQVPTGSVTILKGALYPNAGHGVVHRSPTIEETGEERLLLRIDTDATQNLWK